MGRKWEVRYVTYSSMVPFVSVALSEWGLGDLALSQVEKRAQFATPT